MPQKVLNEDWSEYDDKKKRQGSDARSFACTEIWEVDYLVKKIRTAYPQFSEDNIRKAIIACCQSIGSPHPRTTFVECVMKRLRN